MSAPKGLALKTLIVAGLTAALYFSALLALVWLPADLSAVDTHPILTSLIAIGLPVSGLMGLLIWRSSQAIAGDLAFRDDLTALPNRRAFMVEAAAMLKVAAAGSVALVLLDVDRLKALNDSCGHQAGDELIRLASRQLEKAAAANGRVYRVGGDEFAILVNRAAGARMSPVVRGLAALDFRFRTCNHVHSISMSFGYASCDEGESLESLFRRTDRRLYDRKEASPLREVVGGSPGWRRTSVGNFGFDAKGPSASGLVLVQPER